MNGWLLCLYLYVSLLNFPFPYFAAHSIGLSPNYWMNVEKQTQSLNPNCLVSCLNEDGKPHALHMNVLSPDCLNEYGRANTCFAPKLLSCHLLELKMENHMLGTWMLLDLPACNNAEGVTSNWTFFLLLAQGFRSWWICGGAHWWWWWCWVMWWRWCCCWSSWRIKLQGVVVLLLLLLLFSLMKNQACGAWWEIVTRYSISNKFLVLTPSLVFVCLHVAALVWVHSKCGDIHVDPSSLLKEQTEQRNSNQGRCHCCCFCCKGFWL